MNEDRKRIVGKCRFLENEINPNLMPKGYRLEITIHWYLDTISYYIFDCVYDKKRHFVFGGFDYFLSAPMTYFEEKINNIISDMDAERKEERLLRKLNTIALNTIYGISSVKGNQTAVPFVKKIIFSGPATVVLWDDGSKTVVKCSEDDQFDPYAAVAQAYTKKIFRTNNQFKKMVDKFLPEEDDLDFDEEEDEQ